MCLYMGENINKDLRCKKARIIMQNWERKSETIKENKVYSEFDPFKLYNIACLTEIRKMFYKSWIISWKLITTQSLCWNSSWTVRSNTANSPLTRLFSQAVLCKRILAIRPRFRLHRPSNWIWNNHSGYSPEGDFWHEALHSIVERPGQRNCLANLIHCWHSSLIDTQAISTVDGHNTAQPICSHVSGVRPLWREGTLRNRLIFNKFSKYYVTPLI